MLASSKISEISKINPHFKCLKVFHFEATENQVKTSKTTVCFYCILGDNLSRNSTKLLPNNVLQSKLDNSNVELFSNGTKAKKNILFRFLKRLANFSL